MRVAFFGSSRFSCFVLDALLASPHSVACVVTQPDMPAGRSMKLTPTQVCSDATQRGLPVLKPARLKGHAEIVAQLRAYAPQALLTASYGQIIPKAVLDLTPWPLNVHPSLLPKLRGASPIRTALLEGLEVTGCCIMRMTPRLDDGDVLLREELSIAAEWNYADLETRLGALGGGLALHALGAVEQGRAVLAPQDNASATFCYEYRKEDARLDWSRPASRLRDFIRAWDPDVGAWTTLPGGRRLKVWRARVLDSAGVGSASVSVPGTVLNSHSQLTVACGEAALELLELQPESKRRMTAAEFLAGHALAANAVLGCP